MQISEQVLADQAIALADGLISMLQPHEIGAYLDTVVDRVTQRIAENCDHGCSVLFNAILMYNAEERLAEQMELFPAETVSPDIQEALNALLDEAEGNL